MKRIGILTTLAFVGLGASLWFAQNYSARWEPQLRAELEKHVGKALKARLRLGEISISFFLRVRLKDVELWDTDSAPETLVFRANEVALRVSLLDLPRALYHRNVVEGIGGITVDTPVINLPENWIQQRRIHSDSSRSPLWFGVVWNNGTFRWRDRQAPRGGWTVYQAHGHYRVRGPRTDALAAGVVENAESLDLHLTTMGKRWSAQARITGGNLPACVALADHYREKPLLPKDWTAEGHFDLDARAGGRLPFPKSIHPSDVLKEAQLILSRARLQPGAAAPPLQINGRLTYDEEKLDVSGLTIKAEDTLFKLSGNVGPFAQPARLDLQAVSSKIRLEDLVRYAAPSSTSSALSGVGRLSISLKGTVPHPMVDVQAEIPEGRLWNLPFQEAAFHARRAVDRWEFDSTRLKLAGGTLALKGTRSAAQSDLQITGSDLSLPDLTQGHGPQGLMNFSLNTQGAPESLRMTGTFSIIRFSWAASSTDTVRGELDLTPTSFKWQGASEDQRIKLQGSGLLNSKSVTLEQALIQLRPGMSLQMHGTLYPTQRRLRAAFTGKNVSLSQDIPKLRERMPSVKGTADLQGTLEGSLDTLTLKAEAQSQDFVAGDYPPSPANLTFRRAPDETFLSLSHQASGTLGMLRAARKSADAWNGSAVVATPRGKADLKGLAYYDRHPDRTAARTLHFQGDGVLSSADGSSWTLPCRFRGQTLTGGDLQGELSLQSPAVKIRGRPSEPLEGKLHWNRKSLQWDGFRWGRSLSTAGALQFEGDNATLAGQLHVRDLSIASWHSLLTPGTKEAVQGTLNGTFTLSGTLSDPFMQFTGKVQKGQWRAFRFDTSVGGTWKSGGLEPVTLDATLATGGRVRFQGRLSLADQTADGSVDVTQFEIQPIGKSLLFPHPLEGKVDGTLTVNGPLNALRFTGHLEGSSLTYGDKAGTPLTLASFVTDLKLEPQADRPNTTRLTISQALAKTKEEEIRLNPGSFVEFSGPKEARLQIGAAIRNLHLGVFTLFGGLDMNGTWKIQPEGFALQGDILTRSLFINDYQLEQGHVQARYYNGVLSFQRPGEGPALVLGTVDFKNAPQLDFNDFSLRGRRHESLFISGSVGPKKWNFTMAGEGLDINTLGGLAAFPYTLNGSADVKIRGLGDLENPDVKGTLEIRDGRVLGLDFQTGSAIFAWQGQRMTFTKLELSDPGRYSLSGTGIFPLAAKTHRTLADKTIDFSLRLVDSNLGLLRSISSEVKDAEGSVQGLIHITGTTDSPSMRGNIRVKNGQVTGAHYFRQVRDFQLEATLDRDKLTISQFSGRSGKGAFIGGGEILFAGFEPRHYDLRLDIPTSKGVEVTVPELAIPESPLAKRFRFLTLASQCDVTGHATFKGTADAPVFSGDATITNGHFTFPPSTKNPPPLGFLQWIRRITWDTTLRFKDDAWFENELVEANLTGQLGLKGPSRRLRVDGGMDIGQGGKISYLGVEFEIQQARFEMHSTDTESGIVNTPYVRGLAESRVQTVDPLTGHGIDDRITLTINYAPIHEIKPQLRSTLDPSLSQEKLLARVTQLEVNDLTPQERSYLYQQQMVRLLDTSLATPLARNILKRTGLVDQVHVSRVINPAGPNTLTDPNNPAATQQDTATNLLAGTKYTVAKNLGSRISLGYGLRFEQGLNQDLTNKLDLRSDVELSYRFISNIYLRGSYDLPSQTPGYLPERKVTIEPHWRFGWWGNTNRNKTPKKTESPPPAPAKAN